jgi:hypothetical protein
MDIYTIIYFIQTPETNIIIPPEIINIIRKYLFYWNYANGYTVEDLRFFIYSYYSFVKKTNASTKYKTFMIDSFIYFTENDITDSMMNKIMYGNTFPTDFDKYNITKNTIEDNITNYIKKKYKRYLYNLKRYQLIQIINDFSIPVIHSYRIENYSFIFNIGYNYEIKNDELKIYKNDSLIITIKKEDKVSIQMNSYTYFRKLHNYRKTASIITFGNKYGKKLKVNFEKYLNKFEIRYINMNQFVFTLIMNQ